MVPSVTYAAEVTAAHDATPAFCVEKFDAENAVLVLG
jgi:hypothetical protein